MRPSRSCGLLYSLPWILGGTGLFLPSAARAEELYYMVVFAAQRSFNRPQHTHTFATFVKATGEGPTLDSYQIENHTISWTAARLQLHLYRWRPEQGVNLDLQASLQLALRNRERLCKWGPYQIQQELYERAVQQVARLESGAVQYKLLDRRFRPHRAICCIHAVSDIHPENRILDSGRARGESASALVVRHLRPWILAPDETHDWVSERLGLSAYPIGDQSRTKLGSCGVGE